MATPLFSILVPTRDRPETLRHTLATLTSQPGDDYEIVVADNCSGPESRRIVDALDPNRVRYIRSDEILPMAINWERGLQLCAGEYITVLGDDDGFLPSTLELCRRVVSATSCDMLAWRPHTYWWPDTIVPWARNLLSVHFGDGGRWFNSRPLLEEFYAGRAGFGLLPMIYQAFFHRGLVEEASRRYGGFFVPTDTAPDVASGIVGLHLTETYIQSARGLTIRGNSGKSNGTAQWVRSLGAKQREVYFREERVGLKGIIHEALVPSPNLAIVIASAKLKCRERYFPDDSVLQVDLRQVLDEMVNSLNADPDAYEENLADVRALAARLEVQLSPGDIAEKQETQPARSWGPGREQDGTMLATVNCDLAGIRTIVEAAQLTEAMLPPAERFLTS